MQILYYSTDCMFFSDTYFTPGFDDKIEKKKISSPDEKIILVLHAV